MHKLGGGRSRNAWRSPRAVGGRGGTVNRRCSSRPMLRKLGGPNWRRRRVSRRCGCPVRRTRRIDRRHRKRRRTTSVNWRPGQRSIATRHPVGRRRTVSGRGGGPLLCSKYVDRKHGKRRRSGAPDNWRCTSRHPSRRQRAVRRRCLVEGGRGARRIARSRGRTGRGKSGGMERRARATVVAIHCRRAVGVWLLLGRFKFCTKC